MPFISTGCQTCRNRRIKCDRKKPTCQQCIKSHRFCLDTAAIAGTVTHTEQAKIEFFIFHLENRYASGLAKRPRGPRSKLPLVVPNSLRYDLQSRALAYYLNYHLQTLTDAPHVLGCLAESVSAWRNSGRECAMVDLALSAIALAVFSRTQKHPPAAAEAAEKYYRLLRVARGQIARVGASSVRRSEQDFDACLLAILLMGRYEGVMHDLHGQFVSRGRFMSSRSWSHLDGAMAILKVWLDDASHCPPTPIMKETRRGLIRFSLLRDLSLPDWILDGRTFGELDQELDYDCLIIRIVNLRSAVVRLRQGTKNRLRVLQAAKELNIEAQELDNAWQDWAVQTPKIWSYQVHTLATKLGPWPRRHSYSSTVYSCARHEYAAVWGQYFTLRMFINSTRLRVLDLLLSGRPSQQVDNLSYEKQRHECMAQLTTLANSLASVISFLLSRTLHGPHNYDNARNHPQSHHQNGQSRVSSSSSSLSSPSNCQVEQTVALASISAPNSTSTPASKSSVTLNTLTLPSDEEETIKPYLASWMIWPLAIASSLEDVNGELQLWFRTELAVLRGILGDGVLAGVESIEK